MRQAAPLIYDGLLVSATLSLGNIPTPLASLRKSETVVTDKLEFKVFEISTRIVAGSNPFISGSPYADLIYPGLSTGARIALELKNALKDDTFSELMT